MNPNSSFSLEAVENQTTKVRNSLDFLLISGEQEVPGLSDRSHHQLQRVGVLHGQNTPYNLFKPHWSFSPTTAELFLLPQITQQIGRCQPVAGMVDFVDVVFCSSLVEPMVRRSCSHRQWLQFTVLNNVNNGQKKTKKQTGVIFLLFFDSLEFVLVQSALVLGLLHPQHHLLHPTGQVLQEDETLLITSKKHKIIKKNFIYIYI